MASTKFQSDLVKDKDTLWDIVKIFHPDIPEEVTTRAGHKRIVKNHMKASAHPHYSWVEIEFRVLGYGYVHICLDNKTNTSLCGSGVMKSDMQEALDLGKVSITAWRIVNDKGYKNEYPRIVGKEELETVALLLSRGYSLISADEWYYYYYQD